MFSADLGPPFTILHSVSHVQDKVHTLEVLLLRVQTDPEESKGSGYSVFLEWITVANTAQQSESGLKNHGWLTIKSDHIHVHFLVRVWFDVWL